MSYRNDHDAALSRIDALEHELAGALEQERKRAVRDGERIAMLERELADLRRHEPEVPRSSSPPARTLELPTSAEPPRRPARRAAIDELDASAYARGPAVSRIVVAMLVALGLAIVAATYVILHHDRESHRARTCTVDTVQANVHVIGIDGARETDLGIAPVKLALEEWGRFRRVELRRDDLDTLDVPVPSSTEGCPTTYELRSR